MFNKILILIAFITVAGCESSTSGTLVIDQEFNVNATIKCSGIIGNPNNTCIVSKTLKAGSYKGTLTAKSRNELFLNIGSGANLDLAINIPQGQSVPESNGEFALTAKQTRQTFDLAGTVASTQTDSEKRRDWESCYVTRHEQVCHPTPHGGYTCHDQVVNYPGRKEVEFFVRTTDKNVVVNLYRPGTNEKLGTYAGGSKYSERRYLYEGYCY